VLYCLERISLIQQLIYEAITKGSSSRCAYYQTLSEDQEDIDNNNGNFEESTEIDEPLEVIREEVVEVVQNPTEETSLSSLSASSPSMQEQEEESEVNSDNEDIHEKMTAQSIQLNRLINMVDSLQSQVKQLQETLRLRKTSSARKKSIAQKGIKTKKKTFRKGSARSRKK